jgi:hypothetical protein
VLKKSSKIYSTDPLGEMAEWLKAQHWKCCQGATSARVRIPLSPLKVSPCKLLRGLQGLIVYACQIEIGLRPGLIGLSYQF